MDVTKERTKEQEEVARFLTENRKHLKYLSTRDIAALPLHPARQARLELAIRLIVPNSLDSEFFGNGLKCLACGSVAKVEGWLHLDHYDGCAVASLLNEVFGKSMPPETYAGNYEKQQRKPPVRKPLRKP
jgi:hypothetical protein